MIRRHLLLPSVALPLALAVGATGCGGDSGERTPQATTTPAAVETTAETETKTGGGKAEEAEKKKRSGDGKTPTVGKKAKYPDVKAPKKAPRRATYTAKISAEEARRIGGDFGRAGPWILSFAGGTYSIGSPRAGVSGRLKGFKTSRLTFGGNRISKQNGDPDKDPCGKREGTYIRSAEGKKLTFRKVSDPCEMRSIILAKTWTQIQR